MNAPPTDIASSHMIHNVMSEIAEAAAGDDEFTERLEQQIRINEAFPGLKTQEATAILFDVNNLYKRCEDVGFRLDYPKLRWLLSRRCDLRYSKLFVAVDNEDRGAYRWRMTMEKNGFTIVTKPLIRYIDRRDGKLVEKGNLDVVMTLAATKLSPSFGHVIIASCDGDFLEVVQDLKEDGSRRVSVMGIRSDDWTGMNEELVKAADNFYDLGSIKDIISFKDVKNESVD